jgi:hypothetical protein
MNEFILFQRDDEEMADIDATAATMFTGVAGSLIRVPKALHVYKPAGTAYTVGAGARLEIKDEDGIVLFSLPAEGLLDQTTAQNRFVLPNARAFNASNYAWKLSASGSIAAAAATQPTVYFKLEYEVVPLLGSW